MYFKIFSVIGIFFALFLTCNFAYSQVQTKRPNVLMICVDDLNDWVGCLGDKQAITPNIDRLASRGLLFTNAQCVVSVCNPSRVATLTGLRPETTGMYENHTAMRDKMPDVVTLPQHFRGQGYYIPNLLNV